MPVSRHYGEIKGFGPIEIVPSELRHADYLCVRLRDIDKKEIWLQDADPLEVLHCPLLGNHKTYTALCEGEPMCMFGTVNYDDSKESLVWALGSDLVNKYKKSFHKASLQIIDMLQADNKKIWNIVPYDHIETIIWLKRLGFMIENHKLILKNTPMLYFSRCKKQKSMATVH
jgi:hypothetical protein